MLLDAALVLVFFGARLADGGAVLVDGAEGLLAGAAALLAEVAPSATSRERLDMNRIEVVLACRSKRRF